MSTDEMYDLAKAHGHIVVAADLPNIGSASYPDGDICIIGLDRNLHGTEERERIAHEVGHCETATFYTIHADAITRAKCEYRANKWAYCRLVPFDDLVQAYRSGINTVWDLADHFGISCETMAKILETYSTQKGY